MSEPLKTLITQKIKAETINLGFSACGISPAEEVAPETYQFYCQWLKEGHQGSMHYLENYLDKKKSPGLLAEGTKSIVSVALNYFPQQMLPDNDFQIAWYAYGKDYHTIIKDKLNKLLSTLQRCFPDADITGKPMCDTGPILERYWAWHGGLGWIGKNTLLVIPGKGSTFFLGELLLNVELEYDQPQENRCGTCCACLQACPTHALKVPHELSAKKCLNYLTIENRNEIPSWAKNALGNYIYGCDRCQKACPWNRFATPTEIEELKPLPDLMDMTKDKWENLTQEQYQRLFKGSAIKRVKYEGLIRNIQAVVSSHVQSTDSEQQ